MSIIARISRKSMPVWRPVVAWSRAYTLIPSTPEQSKPSAQDIQDHNPIHALYNNHNQSVQDTHYADKKIHVANPEHYQSADTFSPAFNTVFDETRNLWAWDCIYY
ncbi:hypothetical protein PHYBLDRAFT_182139 [Phycomyces blakesleeanus NRRL 1555(-)]|uniref:Uncharacterized protein n=1 Tax=Phycomyces blakesleeanus (strain ATCC 8743b / DSM 1359 / FGSC 10004 / NBRC 33097 / NRRL 1555) TaxID=763407 RepID=A0A167LUS2_PHYB8|nr:hypothetical protein PHYBLDRAFT_182139 [Phycomyces blakesleeanus NRRL 1555(-)]OAD71139.1 hypothetical protein PHYBLDRAFT_182139 [Phycomyces blakesleeanus NRRL 1555(-)]|eukprot:XP_018289179.1 hypothetical protein PHYBLDRAFT_182139 [Phycomyces blakesleeanus NRRL 1555(-)]